MKTQRPEAERVGVGDELSGDGLDGGQGEFLVEIAQGRGGGDDGKEGSGAPERDGVDAPFDVRAGGLGCEPAWGSAGKEAV